MFEFVADQAGSPGYVGAAVTNKTQVGALPAPAVAAAALIWAPTPAHMYIECAPSSAQQQRLAHFFPADSAKPAPSCAPRTQDRRPSLCQTDPRKRDPPFPPPIPFLPSLQLELAPAGTEFQVVVINLDLKEGSPYFMRISATNGAGLEGFRWVGLDCVEWCGEWRGGWRVVRVGGWALAGWQQQQQQQQQGRRSGRQQLCRLSVLASCCRR